MMAKQTNAYLNFNLRFSCIVRNCFLIDLSIAEQFGVHEPTPGIDDDWELQEVNVAITIAQMSEIVERGGYWTFTDPKDTVRAYEIICGHLEDWLVRAQSQVNRIPPLEDLKKLDDLAAMIYERAKIYYRAETPSSEIYNRLSALNFRNKKPQVKTEVKEKHNKLTEQLLYKSDRGPLWS
jgi:hypothetical protein